MSDPTVIELEDGKGIVTIEPNSEAEVPEGMKAFDVEYALNSQSSDGVDLTGRFSNQLIVPEDTTIEELGAALCEYGDIAADMYKAVVSRATEADLKDPDSKMGKRLDTIQDRINRHMAGNPLIEEIRPGEDGGRMTFEEPEAAPERAPEPEVIEASVRRDPGFNMA